MKVNEEKEKENLLPCLLPGFLKLCSQNSKSFLSPLAMDLRSSLLSWKNILSLKLKTLWKLASYLSLCQSRLLFKQCPQKYPSLSSPKTHLSAPKKVSLSKAPPQKYLPEILSTLTSKTKESPLQLPKGSFFFNAAASPSKDLCPLSSNGWASVPHYSAAKRAFFPLPKITKQKLTLKKKISAASLTEKIPHTPESFPTAAKAPSL